MLKIDVISVQPKMFRGFLEESIVARAVRKGACGINIVDLRDFAHDAHRKVDDKPYGGGPGMLMMCGPWFEAVEAVVGRARCPQRADGGLGASRPTSADGGLGASRPTSAGGGLGIVRPTSAGGGLGTSRPTSADGDEARPPRIIMTSPAGRRFDQRLAEEFAAESHLVFMCGHYEGFDARIETLATDFVSIGDFVMTGGELAAAAMVDATVRLLPGVLGGGPAAVANESFSASGLVEAPQYTHPADFRGMKVPEILLSGDHAKIEAWHRAESRRLTDERRRRLEK